MRFLYDGIQADRQTDRQTQEMGQGKTEEF